jgi:hypothetical protein
MLDLLTRSENERIVSILSPHLLRYQAVAAIISNNCSAHVEKMKWREQKYSDEFTQFITTLFEDFDVEKAQGMVSSLVEASQQDIFLRPLAS